VGVQVPPLLYTNNDIVKIIYKQFNFQS